MIHRGKFKITTICKYLLGQFSQELKEWGHAIEAYETIVRNFPEHPLAADAQYKLAQAYEEAERFDDTKLPTSGFAGD